MADLGADTQEGHVVFLEFAEHRFEYDRQFAKFGACLSYMLYACFGRRASCKHARVSVRRLGVEICWPLSRATGSSNVCAEP